MIVASMIETVIARRFGTGLLAAALTGFPVRCTKLSKRDDQPWPIYASGRAARL
jgi:hypothetical protein